MIIVTDTREQFPLKFRKSKVVEDVVVKTLNTGDYSIQGYEDQIAFERKSCQDLFSTLGSGHKRFKKELERAQTMDYFCIIIESSFTDVLTKNFGGSHYSKMQGHVIIKILMTLKFKYNIDFVFCNNRTESAKFIREMFKSWLHNRT